MHGNIVSAARWLGASTILASCILVFGPRCPLVRSVEPTAPVETPIPVAEEEVARAEPMSAEDARKLLAPICAWLGEVFAAPEQEHKMYRINELLQKSDDLRKIELEWERIWFDEKNGPMTYDRVYGPIE